MCSVHGLIRYPIYWELNITWHTKDSKNNEKKNDYVQFLLRQILTLVHVQKSDSLSAQQLLGHIYRITWLHHQPGDKPPVSIVTIGCACHWHGNRKGVVCLPGLALLYLRRLIASQSAWLSANFHQSARRIDATWYSIRRMWAIFQLMFWQCSVTVVVAVAPPPRGVNSHSW